MIFLMILVTCGSFVSIGSDIKSKVIKDYVFPSLQSNLPFFEGDL